LVESAYEEYRSRYAEEKVRLNKQLTEASGAVQAAERTRTHFEEETAALLPIIRKRTELWRSTLNGLSRQIGRLLATLEKVSWGVLKLRWRFLWSFRMLRRRVSVILLWFFAYRWRIFSVIAIATLFILFVTYFEELRALLVESQRRFETSASGAASLRPDATYASMAGGWLPADPDTGGTL